MASDDRFRQYSEAGEEFLEAARSRAVEFLRELAKAGQTTQKQATGQVEDLVDAGRKGTDQVLDVIRKEIASQLGALGLATKDDLAALERRLSGASPATNSAAGRKAPGPTGKASGSSGKTSGPAKAAAKKAAPVKAAASGAPVKKAAAKKAAGARRAPAAKKASGTTKSS
ncbi:hypothetical protein K6U06_10270 [Acidiferrimicrobium sp. IK]|uniref:hypothetical protein n=1 Tax=Acidiferrimicrobium sp. IK TaxID=2871700 RepID=UPI0021CB13CF|nr:hypothetical protein [Acidiferrimicrobium sp. IK]MCU4184745.1 hypothetical protein [Acidiferrimicrobium sp. IK]